MTSYTDENWCFALKYYPESLLLQLFCLSYSDLAFSLYLFLVTYMYLFDQPSASCCLRQTLGHQTCTPKPNLQHLFPIQSTCALDQLLQKRGGRSHNFGSSGPPPFLPGFGLQVKRLEISHFTGQKPQYEQPVFC